MSDDEIRSRAGRARVELGETEAAFAAMRENAVSAWLATRESEAGYREALYRAVKTIDTVREHLLALVQDGEVAAFAEALKADA